MVWFGASEFCVPRMRFVNHNSVHTEDERCDFQSSHELAISGSHEVLLGEVHDGAGIQKFLRD